MDAKVRCIIKRPDEKYGHVTNISTSLKNLQNIVGGHIETVALEPGKSIILCNEDGKNLGLPHNIFIGSYPFFDQIVGDLIVIGVDELAEDFVDLEMPFKTWKALLDEWGNNE